MSDGSLPSVCHYITWVTIFSAPGTFFGTHHPVPKSMPHNLDFYHSSIHFSLSTSVPDSFCYHINNHEISMTCSNIRYFFVDGFCSSAGANVLQASVLLFVWRIWDSHDSTCLRPRVKEPVTIWTYSFQSRYWKFPQEEEKYLSSRFITGTFLSISTFLWSKQLMWPSSTSVEWGSILHP